MNEDPYIAIGDVVETTRRIIDCERIKTIGDAYLAVCGMPVENENHAENIVSSGIDMINYLEKRNRFQCY